MPRLQQALVWFTWTWAAVFLPIETYLSVLNQSPVAVSGYVGNVCGVGMALWATTAFRRRRPYAAGLLSAGWAWTTAVFWRATNLRYMLAGTGEPLTFGPVELWLAPLFTVMAAAALVGSVVLLVRGVGSRA